MTEFYVIIARKIFIPNFSHLPPPPAPTPTFPIIDDCKINQSINGVFSDLKGDGVRQGYISGVYFQKCSKFGMKMFFSRLYYYKIFTSWLYPYIFGCVQRLHAKNRHILLVQYDITKFLWCGGDLGYGPINVWRWGPHGVAAR